MRPVNVRFQRSRMPPLIQLATRSICLTGNAKPAFVSEQTIALVEAARAGAGIAVLPRYLGDSEPTLRHLPMPDEPREPVWITVHRDLKQTPRVRVVLDHLSECLERDRRELMGG